MGRHAKNRLNEDTKKVAAEIIEAAQSDKPPIYLPLKVIENKEIAAVVTNTTPIEGYVCRQCGSTNCEIVGDFPSTEYSGEIDGKVYTAVHRARVVCECGQHGVKFSYTFEGK